MVPNHNGPKLEVCFTFAREYGPKGVSYNVDTPSESSTRPTEPLVTPTVHRGTGPVDGRPVVQETQPGGRDDPTLSGTVRPLPTPGTCRVSTVRRKTLKEGETDIKTLGRHGGHQRAPRGPDLSFGPYDLPLRGRTGDRVRSYPTCLGPVSVPTTPETGGPETDDPTGHRPRSTSHLPCGGSVSGPSCVSSFDPWRFQGRLPLRGP